MSADAATATRVAIAIFVKTPGFSPIKTRLAATIGREAAEDFHRLAANAVAEVASDPSLARTGATALWAVAEPDAMEAPPWRGLPRIAQGEGDLGVRMRRVYDTLRARHDAVLLLGADTPQIRVDDLRMACASFATHDHALGPSEDGGFWAFGGKRAVADDAWRRTPWSRADTRARFAAALCGDIAELRMLRDVDALDDLRALRTALKALPSPTPSQRALDAWLDARAD